MALKPTWLADPEPHDYDAAESFLSLLCTMSKAKRIADLLREAKTITHPAKDILRASGLQLLPPINPHVAKDLAKIKEGKRLSPVLLRRGEGGHPLIVADGLHRICACYHLDENALIPCRLVP